MPVSTDLLGIFFAGNRIARNRARNFFGTETNRSMSSLGRLRGRSRATGGGGCRSRQALRVIRGRKQFYGSNRVDCHYPLRHRFGGVGMVDRQKCAAAAGVSQLTNTRSGSGS
jgi:hypothetical protein